MRLRWLLAAIPVALALACWFLLRREPAHAKPTVRAAASPVAPEARPPTERRAIPSPRAAPPSAPEPVSDGGEFRSDYGKDIPSREDCSLCLQSICAAEVAAGGSVEAALCLIPCERWLSESTCRSGLGQPLFAKGPPQRICPGAERSEPTWSLVRCGKACPCPMDFEMGGPAP
jgi:hypothetical protein